MSVRYAVPAHNPAGLVRTSRLYGGIMPPAAPDGLDRSGTRTLGTITVTATGPTVLLGIAVQGASNVGGVARQVPRRITVQPGSRVLLRLVAPITLNPAGVQHTRAQGSPTISPTLNPAGLQHSRAQGAPTINPTVAPSGLSHTRTQGSPTVGSVTAVSPASLTRTRTFSTPVVNPTLNPAGIQHTRALGDPTVTTSSPPPRTGLAVQGASNIGGLVRQVPRPVLEPRRTVSTTVTGLAAAVQALPAGLDRTGIRALGNLTVGTPPTVTQFNVLVAGQSNTGRVTVRVPVAPAQEPKQPIPGVFVFIYSAPPIFNVIVPGGTNQGYQYHAVQQPPVTAARSSTVIPGRTALGGTVSPTGLQHTRALGAPTVNPKVAPAGLQHSRAQGNPTVALGARRALGAITVTSVGIARPAGQEHARSLGAPTAHGLATITVTALTRTRVQGTPVLSGRALPAGLTRTRTLGSPSVNPVTLTPASLTRTRTFTGPTVTITRILRPDATTHTRGQGTITVIGHMTVGPPSLDRTRLQGNPTLSGRALPAGLTRTRTLGAPAVNVITLAPAALDRA